MVRISVVKRLAVITGLLLALLAVPARLTGSDDDDETGGAKFSPEAAATFNKRCTACHTFGKGIKVGPDLKGVTQRRTPAWLRGFIHSSSEVIKKNDPTAVALFAQFKQQRMPDWIDLTDKQIDDILYYLSISGPEIKPADEKNAESATADEIEKGRQLFFGERPLKYGSYACSTCHAIQGASLRGGSLGPNLTNTYDKYQDLALTAFLRKPCFQWALRTTDHYLTTKESFAVKAFLRQSGLRHSASRDANASSALSAKASQPPATGRKEKRGNQ